MRTRALGRKSAISASFPRWSDTPASIAGLIRGRVGGREGALVSQNPNSPPSQVMPDPNSWVDGLAIDDGGCDHSEAPHREYEIAARDHSIT